MGPSPTLRRSMKTAGGLRRSIMCRSRPSCRKLDELISRAPKNLNHRGHRGTQGGPRPPACARMVLRIYESKVLHYDADLLRECAAAYWPRLYDAGL